MKKTMLIIGGTGIVGKPAVFEALKQGYAVTTISITADSRLPPQVNQIVADRRDRDAYTDMLLALNEKHKSWDIVFEIFNLGVDDARQLYECFKTVAKHIFIVSTTLVYDRSIDTYAPIKSAHSLAKKGLMGGYADHKIELEQFWHEKKDINWTILRPYHVLGGGSLLGCAPMHNRDPELLQRVMRGESLALCNAGNGEFNFIHPTDIARIVLKAAGNPNAYGKSYNAVNPARILIKDYFQLLGDILGEEIKIVNKDIVEIWNEENGWMLTTLPHLYDVSDLKRDIDFVPDIPLERAMQDALWNYPEVNMDVAHIPVHRRMTLLPRPARIDWLLQG